MNQVLEYAAELAEHPATWLAVLRKCKAPLIGHDVWSEGKSAALGSPPNTENRKHVLFTGRSLLISSMGLCAT